ncbi:MAG: sugar ABC transporter permease [Clostridiaceae bacterium]|nr:sugar ABC transporter permease [Clostridiales bacterium]MDD6876284.1 sugar ABC transporter permease [Clostridiaceae bacterium]MDY3072487.1 sugar ABC transporter permease [Eubacteriales bacterium]MDY5015520.1 sugar ABC transporter permease [Eubacteriales bacterium]
MAEKAAGRSRRGLTPKAKEGITGYVFILPWLIGLLVFTVYPMFSSLYYSLTDYDLLNEINFVGFKNYIDIFTKDARFLKSVKVTLTYTLFQVPLKLGFALFVAMLFKGSRRGVNVYRSLYYLPSIFGGSIAISIMWRQIFGRTGAVNGILKSLGLITTAKSWIASPDTALGTLILLSVWQFGSPMLIFLAGLKQIPQSYYEAASIDGAGAWKQFLHITLPSLSPIIFYNFLMQTIGSFMSFTQSYIVTAGGPVDETLMYALYIYQTGFTNYHMGYASALSWISLIIIGIITAVIFKTSNYWVFYESKAE